MTFKGEFWFLFLDKSRFTNELTVTMYTIDPVLPTSTTLYSVCWLNPRPLDIPIVLVPWTLFHDLVPDFPPDQLSISCRQANPFLP